MDNTSQPDQKTKDISFVERYDIGEYRGRLYEEGLVVGETRLKLLSNSKCPEEHYLWYSLEDFFIDPKHRKNGLGDLLFDKLTEHARENCKSLLYVFREPICFTKEKLVGFLLKRGFKFHDIDKNGDYRFYYTFDGTDIEQGERK